MITDCFYIAFNLAREITLREQIKNLDKPFFHGNTVTTGI